MNKQQISSVLTILKAEKCHPHKLKLIHELHEDDFIEGYNIVSRDGGIMYNRPSFLIYYFPVT